MNLSNISKHAKAARNADIKRRESIIKENPQPVEPVLISQEPIITGEVHAEIPDEILMDMVRSLTHGRQKSVRKMNAKPQQKPHQLLHFSLIRMNLRRI